MENEFALDDIRIGLVPEFLLCQITDSELCVTNSAAEPFSQLKLTISYYDGNGSYLDFEDIELDDIPARGEQRIPLKLNPPDQAVSATVDVTGTRQTFLQRNWKWLSTIAIVIWGLIILSRRLAPDFT